MKRSKPVLGLVLALAVSSGVVGCDRAGDTDDRRAALEREAIARELELALQPDTTVEPELADVPLPAPEPLPEPEQAAPAPQPAPEPAPRRPEPRRERRPEPQPRAERPAESRAEPAPEPARPRTVSLPVPSGTTLAVQLGRALSTESARAGSVFTASLAEPVYAADGTLLIPAGATVRGRVTEARRSDRAGQDAMLAVAFTSLSFGGADYPLSATAVDVPVRLVNRDSNVEKAAKIGGGAAAGAILGQVIGKNTKSTVAGAVIGAAAGTAVAMGTAEVDAVIPEGARMVIRLDSPIYVERTL